MTLAGTELGVTHGAISRQIQLLEASLGVMLLRRLAKSVEPTSEGKRLAANLSAAFNLINLGISQLQPGPLTISCSATIIQNWLIPRLGAFKQKHGDIEIRLNVNYGEVDLIRDEISLAIRNDMIPAPQDVILHTLIREEIGLVCSPDFAKKYQLPQSREMKSVPILSTKTRPRAWKDWMDASGFKHTDDEPQQIFEHFYLMIQAASYGLGAAVAPRIMVDSEIASGRLIAPYGFLAGPYNIVLWMAPHLRSRPDLRTLVDWIKDEFTKLGSTGA